MGQGNLDSGAKVCARTLEITFNPNRFNGKAWARKRRSTYGGWMELPVRGPQLARPLNRLGLRDVRPRPSVSGALTYLQRYLW